MSVIRAEMKVVSPYRCTSGSENPNCCRCVYNKGFIPVAADEWPSIQVLCVRDQYEQDDEEEEE